MDFQQRCTFDLNTDLPALLQSLPSHMAVFLLEDEQARPFQLLTGRLRDTLQRKLTPDPTAQSSRAIDYRQHVRSIRYTLVDSPFEADWLHLEYARHCFPDSYASHITPRELWLARIDPAQDRPCFTRTDKFTSTGDYFGPFLTKTAASAFIEQAQDWFDLCRYHATLLQSPHASPCVYKSLGKCPGPCDGSISLEAYRTQIHWALDALSNPSLFIHQQTARMTSAATELHFEQAARIKQFIDSLSQLIGGKYRLIRPMHQFHYLGLQRGPRPGTAKAFLIGPGTIEPLSCLLTTESTDAHELLDTVRRTLKNPLPNFEPIDTDRLALTASHILRRTAKSGIFLPIGHLDSTEIRSALGSLWPKAKKRNPRPMNDRENISS